LCFRFGRAILIFSRMAFIDCSFFSETLGLATALSVILPESPAGPIRGVGRRGQPKHPTLLLLHGLSDDHTFWMRKTSIERYASERGLAVVMPAAGRSFYQDMASGPKYWTFLSCEVPRVARSFFPLSSARRHNFVAGLSMGGYGAFRVALACPESYAAAASLSGALDLVARFSPTNPRKTLSPQEVASIFGPRAAVAGTSADLFRLAAKVARSKGPKPRLYQYCGTADFLYADNVRFRDFARRKKLDLTYVEDGGDHQWAVWDEQIRRVIAWLPLD
jgi:putative tributyrin esterase